MAEDGEKRPTDGRQAPPGMHVEQHGDGTMVVAGVVHELKLSLPPKGPLDELVATTRGLVGLANGLVVRAHALTGRTRELTAAVTEFTQAIDRLTWEIDEFVLVPDDLARVADKLAGALHGRWQAEGKQRGIQDADPLPVRWHSVHADQLELDHPERIWGDQAEDDLSGRLDEIAEVHRRLPYRRLVVLGPGGSGKSVLGVRFVLRRLEHRRPGKPVAEIFGLGSWNLAEDSLEDWLSRQLRRDQPWLAEVTADGRTTLAEELVNWRLILPVLDGFDEIPGPLRARARELLSESSLPYVLTSRREEYRTAVADSRGLHRAAVVELAELSPDDAVEYLRLRSSRHARPDWDRVQAEMEGNPDGPLGRALSTPLMVDLAAIVHGERGTSGAGKAARGPAKLLDEERFDTREAIEDDLLGGFLHAVYRDRPAEHRERVQEWYGYLAHHLGDSSDLKWWELGGRTVSRPVRMVVVGSVTGLAFAFLDMLVLWSLMPFVVPKPPYWIAAVPLNGAFLGVLTGTGFGLVYALTDGGRARRPSGVSVRILGGTRPTRRTLGRRLVVGLTGGFGFGFVTWFATGLVADALTGTALVPALLSGLRYGLAGGLGSGLALGLAYGGGGAGRRAEKRLRLKGVIGHFRRRVGPRLAIGYAAGFSAGLVFSIVGPLVTDLATGGGTGLGTVLASAVVSALSYGSVIGLPYALTAALATPIPAGSVNDPASLLRTSRTAVLQQSLANTLVFAVVGWPFSGRVGHIPDWAYFTLVLGLGLGLAYGLALTAWGHWMVLSRVWLPLTGRLPWGVDAFLKDAHRRGVLRHSGAVYQFRHARLKEHLARTYEEE
ncbi:NACHT domain-containing protein [Streptomyces sp. Ag109_O5-1]|uniref:NACHT domain-containing protein n=1 Tax=Streptomyces sp. Ag109_O5-1 TaxID=1938851 RepID=UPI000F503B74|nr:NACHT domain-containing protein [Streptomyces sp. Ag109_O5-1]RPE42043.1 NACHT domain-containing protein [Streptomyces sp. Ag109_O5-1]